MTRVRERSAVVGPHMLGLRPLHVWNAKNWATFVGDVMADPRGSAWRQYKVCFQILSRRGSLQWTCVELARSWDLLGGRVRLHDSGQFLYLPSSIFMTLRRLGWVQFGFTAWADTVQWDPRSILHEFREALPSPDEWREWLALARGLITDVYRQHIWKRAIENEFDGGHSQYRQRPWMLEGLGRMAASAGMQWGGLRSH